MKSTTNNNKVMIECKGLTKHYGEFKALDELDLDITRGEIFAFVGPNGAGKTTTMNVLAGLIKPASGEAVISGHNIIKDPVGPGKVKDKRAGEFSKGIFQALMKKLKEEDTTIFYSSHILGEVK